MTAPEILGLLAVFAAAYGLTRLMTGGDFGSGSVWDFKLTHYRDFGKKS